MKITQMDSSCLPQGLLAHCTRSLQALLRPPASPDPTDPADKQGASGDEAIDKNACAVVVAAQVDACVATLQQQIGHLAAAREPPPTQPAEYRAAWHSILNDVLTSLGAELRKEAAAGETAGRVCTGELAVGDLLRLHASNLQANVVMFTAITEHHRTIADQVEQPQGTWLQALSSQPVQQGLSAYGAAAVSMGNKGWVRKGQEWIEQFTLQFFYGSGAVTAYVKSQKVAYFARHGVYMPAEEQQALRSSLPPLIALPETQRIRVLDVGSCYNPHRAQQKFLVTALDLEPTHHTVYQCDFLALDVLPAGAAAHVVPRTDADTRALLEEEKGAAAVCPIAQRLCGLAGNSFHMLTMSLVLNYLPSSTQRLDMLRKARQLLLSPPAVPSAACPPHSSGLLLILEKESVLGSGGKRGAMLLKSWKVAISVLGFELVTYQLMHTEGRKCHLFAFRAVHVAAATTASAGKGTGAQEGQEGPLPLPLPLYCKHDLEALDPASWDAAMAMFEASGGTGKAENEKEKEKEKRPASLLAVQGIAKKAKVEDEG